MFEIELIVRFERRVKEGDKFDDEEKEFFYTTMIKDFKDFFNRFSSYTYVDANIPDVCPRFTFHSPLRLSCHKESPILKC